MTPTAPTPASVSSLFAPLPERAPVTPASLPPSALPAEEQSTHLPGERLVSAPRRPVTPAPASDLPPFLAQQPTSAPAPAGVADRVAPAVAPALTPPVTLPSGEPAQATPDDGDSDEPPASNQLVNIKGRSDGIAVEIGRGGWSEILDALTKRLEQSAGFFRNGSVALDVGPRPVVEDELRQLAAVLTQFEMKLGVVRTSSERTFQAALATGMTATLESSEGAPVAAAAPAATNTDAASYFVYRGYLRSGHRLRRKENILVIGDINPGAEVISEGDILVWGRLRGVVHAGGGRQSARHRRRARPGADADAHRRRDNDWPRPQTRTAGALLLEEITAQTPGNRAPGAERNHARRMGCSAPGRADLIAAWNRMSEA
jgi:septum site-determining protein MinC